MNSETENAKLGDAKQNDRVGGNVSGGAGRQPVNAAPMPPAATSDFTDPAKHRKERIKKLEARLQREIARDNGGFSK